MMVWLYRPESVGDPCSHLAVHHLVRLFWVWQPRAARPHMQASIESLCLGAFG